MRSVNYMLYVLSIIVICLLIVVFADTGIIVGFFIAFVGTFLMYIPIPIVKYERTLLNTKRHEEAEGTEGEPEVEEGAK